MSMLLIYLKVNTYCLESSIKWRNENRADFETECVTKRDVHVSVEKLLFLIHTAETINFANMTLSRR
jgi:hypothetical protein